MSPEHTTGVLNTTDRQEFQRVVERPATPRSNGWKERKNAIPFLQPSDSQEHLMDDAIALRRERISIKKTVRVPREGLFRIGTRDEVQHEHHPIPRLESGLRNFANFLVEKINARKIERVSTQPRENEEGQTLPSELSDLFHLAANETMATQVVLFSHDLPDRSRSYTRSLQTAADLANLLNEIQDSTQGPSASFDAPALQDITAHLLQDTPLNESWLICRAQETPEAMSELVVAKKDGEIDDESAYTVLYPGEVVLLHQTEDKIDSMIRFQRNDISPDLEVSYAQPQVDLELSSETALFQAIRIMIDKEACFTGRRLPIIRRQFAEISRLQESEDVSEILAGLQQYWGETFAPFIDRIREKVEKEANQESKRRSIDTSTFRFVRQLITRDIPALDTLLQEKASLLVGVKAELGKIQETLAFEALDSLDEETVEHEIKCRYSQQLLELCGMSPVLTRSAKGVLVPFYEAFTTETELLKVGELKSPESLERRLSPLVEAVKDFLKDATERRGSNNSGLTPQQLESLMNYLRATSPGISMESLQATVVESEPEQREQLTLTQLEQAIASLKLRIATVASAADQTRATFIANGETNMLQAQADELSQIYARLRADVDTFCKDWNCLLNMDSVLSDAYVKLPLMPNEFLASSVSQMVAMIEARLRPIRELTANFQHDLALKINEYPMSVASPALFNGAALLNGDQPSATLHLIDGLVALDTPGDYVDHLKLRAKEALIASLLNNESPTQ